MNNPGDDICDDKRRRKVFEHLRRWGNHLQYSVFRCKLSPSSLEELHEVLEGYIDDEEDQILLFDMGPAEGRASSSVIALGQPYTHPERHAIVV